MNWSTELIDIYDDNEIPIIRDARISSVLGEERSYPDTKPYYRNIKGLRSPNLEFDYSDDEKSRMLDFNKTPIEISRYTTLYGQDIKLRDYQKDIVNNLNDDRYIIINSARQIGLSMCVAIQTLHYMMVNSDKTILFIAPKQLICVEMYDRIYDMYSNMPFFIKSGVVSYENGKYIKFDNGSRILFRSTVASSIGHEYDNIILGDFAFHQDDVNIINRILPVCHHRSGKLVIYSTPNKSDDQFAKIFKRNDNSFKKYEYCYDVVPGRDKKWVDNNISSVGGVLNFLKEYMCCFPDSQQTIREFKMRLLGL